MQTVNTFILMMSAVLILAAGIVARKVSKGHAVRTVFGILAPVLFLTLSYTIVEMIVAGYEETAKIVGAEFAAPHYLFPRYAFSAIIGSFAIITLASVIALKMRDRINPTSSFFIGSLIIIGVSAAVALISLSEEYEVHSAVIMPIAAAFAMYEIFALADTLLDTKKKLRRVILYIVHILFAALSAFLMIFAFTYFKAELDIANGNMSVAVVIGAAVAILVIAGPIFVSACSLIANGISSYKYIAKGDKRLTKKG